MKKFIVLYHAPESALKMVGNKSKEEQKKGMDAWYAWAKKCGRNLVDLGNPLGNGTSLSQKGSKKSNKSVCGYSIIKAKSMADAKKLLKNHPHMMWTSSCSIEVHEALPLPK